eukprot:COSAG02_NODE_1485_length_12370_cov_6.022144_9_plen_41_part_00
MCYAATRPATAWVYVVLTLYLGGNLVVVNDNVIATVPVGN